MGRPKKSVELDPVAFEFLLNRLDPDRSAAGEEYNTLRQKIEFKMIRCGCAEAKADELTDLVINKLAVVVHREVEEKIVLIDSTVFAYALGIAQNVWKNHVIRTPGQADIDTVPEPSTPICPQDFDADASTACVRSCLIENIPNERDRTLLLEYFDEDTFRLLKEKRAALADLLGFTTGTLKKKVCNLKSKSFLECMSGCIEKRSGNKSNDL